MTDDLSGVLMNSGSGGFVATNFANNCQHFAIWSSIWGVMCKIKDLKTTNGAKCGSIQDILLDDQTIEPQ